MTNEELAVKIGVDGNDDLLPVLWEQTQKYFRMRADKYYRAFCDECMNAGVTVEDLYQECFLVLIEAISAYNKRPPEQTEYLLLTYCKYPIKSHFAVMLGYRRRTKDALNGEKFSLNDPIAEGELCESFLDVIVDPEGEQPFRDIEDADFYRDVCRFIAKQLRECDSHEYEVIKRRYICGQSFKQIADILGLSAERVRQIEKSALSVLRESYELKQLTIYSPYRHIGLENFKHNGSIEEQIVERKELDSWRNKVLESILQKG